MKPTLLLLRPPPAKAVTERTAGSSSVICASWRCLSRMAGKLMSCAAMVWPPSRPVSCCGKKPLGTIDEEIDVQERRADGHAEDQRLVAQHPAQRRVVFVVKPFGMRFRWRDRCGRAGFRRVTSETSRTASACVVSETSSETAMATLRA